MVATACPTADELKNYTLGRLSQQDWAAIAEHLESCRQCQAAIATVDDVADTLVTQLREPATGDSFLNESQCEAALQRARDIKSGTGILPVEPENNTGKMPVPPGVEFEGYQILEELGQGGMGAVYKALHTKLDRVVAIKILTRGRAGDERAIARFEREMKAVGRFDHPHIVRAYDAREIGGAPVLIMEFVEGMDLGRLVRRLGPLPVAEACELVRQACLGLQYIHEQGLVHRDLKPSNLMLTRQGTVKILDLGLARFHFEQSEEEMTNSGQAMGTADYMAPEQASDSHAVDIRADIYSLGCTLYKLLAGFAPFEGSQYKGTFEKMTAHVQQSAPPIENLLPEIPRELAAILEKMLAKNPADRFAQPADVIEALTPFCANAALSALLKRAEETQSESPLSLRERARVRADQVDGSNYPATQPNRRRPSILVAIGLLLFVLGFASGFSLGIIVMIKKGGETTTVEAPEGSNVHVDGQGNVGVDLNANKFANTVGPESFKILPGDVLHITINESNGWPGSINGDFKVDQSGMLDFSTAKIEGITEARQWIIEHFKNLEPVSVQGLSLEKAEERIMFHVQRVFINGVKTVVTFDRKTLERRIKSASQEPSQNRGIAEKQELNARNPPEQHKQRYTSDMVPVPDSYRLSPGDILSVNAGGVPESLRMEVFGKKEKNGPGRDLVIDDEGMVDVSPMIGKVKLQGLSLDEAERAVEKRLKEVKYNPEISFSIRVLDDQFKLKADEKSQSYRIAPGDLIDVIPKKAPENLWLGGNPSRVQSDGTAHISLGPHLYSTPPMQMNFKGLTIEEAQKALKDKLMDFIDKNQNLFIQKQSIRVSVKLITLKENKQNSPETHNESSAKTEPESHNIDLSTSDGKAAIPPEPYTILPGDSLLISAVGTIPNDPIDGIYIVEPAGTVALGPAYGRASVKGLSLVEAEGAIAKELKKILLQPEVSVTLAGWVDRSKPQAQPEVHRIAPGDILDIWADGTLIDQPIHGPYLVEPDGQVSLGPAYGRVNLKGQTFEEAEATVLKQLQQMLRQPEVSITLGGWRKGRKQIEDELKQKANASKISRVDVFPLRRGVKTSDVNVTLAPPLLQPTQGSLISSLPINPSVPVLPGLPLSLPPESYKIAPGNYLKIRANTSLNDYLRNPANIFISRNPPQEGSEQKKGQEEKQAVEEYEGVVAVEPTGTIWLGSEVGKVQVQGLSLAEAEKAIEKSLLKFDPKPKVSVKLFVSKDRPKEELLPDTHYIAPGETLDIIVAGTMKDQPIDGSYYVEPNGEVTLGPAYGRVYLKGLSFPEAEEVLTTKLQDILKQPVVSITLEGWGKVRKPTPKETEETQKERGSERNKIKPNQSMNPPETESGEAAAARTAAEMKALQGRWKVVNIEKEKDGEFALSTSAYVEFGKPTKESVGPTNPFHATNAYKAFMHSKDFNKGEYSNFIYKVDPTAKTKTIDLYEESFRPPGVKGELSALGIYELDGDQLKICLANYRPPMFTDPRPKDFTIKPDSDNVLVTLQRFPPTADEKEIQGKWDVILQTDDGTNISESAANNIANISFSDSSSEISGHDNKRNATAPYVIIPDKVPKRFISYGYILDRHSMAYIWSGIYKFEGERLWIAFRIGRPVPEKFESMPGSGITLLELRRSEPKKEEQAEPKKSDNNIPAESAEQKKTQEKDEKE